MIKSSIALTLAALTVSASATAAQAEKPANVVLVHGAFADGSGWRGVYEDLTRRGYRVSIVQNPLTSLAEDVAATKRVLARQNSRPSWLGDSVGGTVITEAGLTRKSSPYQRSASPLERGETTAQQYEASPQLPISSLIRPIVFGFLNGSKFKARFAVDA